MILWYPTKEVIKMFDREKYNKKVEFFVKVWFGMFIHLGIYEIPAIG